MEKVKNTIVYLKKEKTTPNNNNNKKRKKGTIDAEDSLT